MEGLARATSRLHAYRRRLAAAAFASLLLHMLLARGLFLTSLGRDGRRPEAGADTREKTRPRADFTIRVPKARASRPAHERPLEIAARPTDRRPPVSRPAVAAAAPRPAAEPRERTTAPAAAAPARSRDDALAAAPAPDRAALSSSADPASRAETIAAPVEGEGEASPAAVTRDRAPDAAVASRWRPREVALLERLTAPAPVRTAPTRETDEGDLSATPATPRAGVDATAAPEAAEPIAGPTGDAEAAVAVGPATRPASRGTRAAVGPRGDAPPGDSLSPEASSAVAADVDAARARREAAGDVAGGGRPAPRRGSAVAEPGTTAAVLDTTGVGVADGPAAASPAPGAAASGGRGRGTSAVVGPRAAGGGRAADGEADAIAGSTTRMDAVGIAGTGPRGGDGSDAAASGGGTAPRGSPTRAPLAADVDGVDGAGGAGTVDVAEGIAADSDAEPGIMVAPGPRTVGLAATVPGAVGEPAGDEADEAELSVPPATLAAAPDARRPDDDGPVAALRAPERVATVVLPAETRVRDVAEAFARRGRETRRRSGPRVARADAMVDRGLEFLARAQLADGRWRLGSFPGSGAADVPLITSDTAATGLALLAFLGAGHDHFDGTHRDTVRRGLEFLLSVQKPDGDLFLPADELSNRCGWLYSHAIASIALCEAVGMTGDPLLRPAADRACGFIAASQHPELGGWRYAPRSDADLSVSAWMLIALRSGALAGVETAPESLPGVRRLLDAAARPGAAAAYAYNPRDPEQRASPDTGLCMTAVGTLMRLHTGAQPDDPDVAAAARILAARRPTWDAGGRDSYLWYCGSQVLVHTGGPAWEAWYATLVDTLAAAQETAGGKAGSWDPRGPRPDRWGRAGGRIYVTALHLLALEVPDRRLPTYTAGE